MDSRPRHIRVFISSPGDVIQERRITWEVIDALPDRPVFRDRVSFRTIAWDRPGSSTPMLAKMTPQEAINLGLPKPGECDIVVVIFWSRMGTPFTLDGKQYLSGTHWEYLNSLESTHSEVVVYRRTEKVEIDLDDPQLDQKREQLERVNQFFASFIDTTTGQALRGVNQYATPEEFRQMFEAHLEELVKRILERPAAVDQAQDTDAAPGILTTSKVWEGSPFPGLRAFTDADAPIFFGRGHEIDALVKRLQTARFVGVVGVSGSGKSSLVGAGLLPRLHANAIEGSKDWLLPTWDNRLKQWIGLRFTPGEVGDNPFMALALKVTSYLQPTAETAAVIARRLAEDPARISEYLESALANKAEWTEILIFIDQFEELFTTVQPALQAPFVQLLHILAQPKLRVRIVATLRVDFYGAIVGNPTLALLFANHHPLPAPAFGSLYEMITRPAERAALQFDEGLPDQILTDTGGEPGSLALMAFLLDELYKASGTDRVLTFAKYGALGKVQGVIAQRAENVLSEQTPETRSALMEVFRSLVQLDEGGTVTRRRAPQREVSATPAQAALVNAFVQARLLVTGVGPSGEALVEVAHEALLTNWPRLRLELDADREFLIWRRQFKNDVQTWVQSQRDSSYLYEGTRLLSAERWRKQRAEHLAALDLEFLDASVSRRSQRQRRQRALFAVLAVLFVIASPIVAISIYNEFLRQQTLSSAPTVAYAAATAQLGLDNQWVNVPAFQLDRYEVSVWQYNNCVLARVCSDIYAPTFDETVDDNHDDHPVTSVNAFQAAVFCRWLGRRLPSADELERAARGTNGRPFPWLEADPDPTRVNGAIDGYLSATPKGTVPVDDPAFATGANPEGVFHLMGNVAEWTRTPTSCGLGCTELWDGQQSEALQLRGGGWATLHLTPETWDTAITELRLWEASETDIDIGFRCAGNVNGA